VPSYCFDLAFFCLPNSACGTGVVLPSMAPIHNQLEHSIMALGKQAKTLTQKQIEVALSYLATTRHGLRNQVIFLLSTKAGLRAKEIAGLRWSMVVDATGQVGTTDLPP